MVLSFVKILCVTRALSSDTERTLVQARNTNIYDTAAYSYTHKYTQDLIFTFFNTSGYQKWKNS